MIRLAANLSTLFCEVPLAERFAMAARAGFRAVELQFPYAMPADDLARALHDTQLELVLINAPAGEIEHGECGLAVEGGSRFTESILQARDYAIRTGCRRIHVLVGNARGGLDPARRRVVAGRLRRAANVLAQDGLTLLLEALNPHDRPGYALPALADAEALRCEIAASNVLLQFDAYHVARSGADPVALLAEYLPVIGHVQIAAVPDRGEPDTGQMLGFLDALLAAGYGGAVGCEYNPRRGTWAGLGWMSRYGAGPPSGPRHSDHSNFELRT